MAKKPTSRYYLVEAGLLPEIFLKVMEAKELLHTGECATVGEAAARVGISRSAFYRYKDSIHGYSRAQSVLSSKTRKKEKSWKCTPAAKCLLLQDIFR